jgi:anti-sigma B factor antagonist
MENIRLETQIVEVQGHKVLNLSGEIDVYSAPQFKQAVVSILDGAQQHLIVDMHNVRYMDSSGFGILLSAVKRLRPNGGTVNLIGCASSIDRVLHITKLDAIFALHQNMDEVMKAISAA